MDASILNTVKDYVEKYISNNDQIPAEKQELATKTTIDSLVNGIKGEASGGNIGSLLGSLTGNTSPLINSLKNVVSSSLTSKAGLNPTLANTIAASLVPGLVNAITSKLGHSATGGGGLADEIKDKIGGLLGGL